MKELWKELNLVNRAILFFQVTLAVTILTHFFEFYTRLGKFKTQYNIKQGYINIITNIHSLFYFI